jgi:hypothetical protein
VPPRVYVLRAKTPKQLFCRVGHWYCLLAVLGRPADGADALGGCATASRQTWLRRALTLR